MEMGKIKFFFTFTLFAIHTERSKLQKFKIQNSKFKKESK